MATATASSDQTMADMLHQLGGISPRRVRIHPAPGTATVKDVIEIHDRTNRLFELVDGVLVEKVMGYPESYLASWLGFLVQSFLEKTNLGILAGEAGAVRLMLHLVRIPDLSYVAWDRLPNRRIPRDPIPYLVPNLAVEVLSEGNTPREMRRKLREYFESGVQVVWFVDPRKRIVQVFTATDQSVTLTEDDTLEGGQVLPGFTLPVRRIFERLEDEPPPATRRRAPQSPRRRRP